MKQFLSGVLVASVLWLGVVFAQSRGVIEIFESSDTQETGVDTAADIPMVDTDSEAAASPKRVRKKRRRIKKRRAPLASDLGYERGEGEVGDDLSAGARSVGMHNGGEEQLSNEEIEAAIDRRFNGIQRCLTLLPPDAPSTGKLVIGMNIAGSGTVTKINLNGPNAMIKGDTGDCFRRIIRGITFRGFDGPDMIVRYPIIFE